MLPLPYCQLLKIFLLCWVFSLPFVIANECGHFLYGIMTLVAAAFFGLDHVGAELECPWVGWWQVPPGPWEDTPPSARLVPPLAQAAPTLPQSAA